MFLRHVTICLITVPYNHILSPYLIISTKIHGVTSAKANPSVQEPVSLVGRPTAYPLSCQIVPPLAVIKKR